MEKDKLSEGNRQVRLNWGEILPETRRAMIGLEAVARKTRLSRSLNAAYLALSPFLLTKRNENSVAKSFCL